LQQQKNGVQLGVLYNHLIGTRFDRNTMYVRSTDVSRTYASIESLLLALFPTVCRLNSEFIGFGFGFGWSLVCFDFSGLGFGIGFGFGFELCLIYSPPPTAFKKQSILKQGIH
jgi:hypothetical protein